MERVGSESFATSTVDSKTATERAYDLGIWFCGYEERSPWLIESPYRPNRVGKWLHVQVEEDRDAHAARRNLIRATGRMLGGRPAKRNWDGYWRQAWRQELRNSADQAGRSITVFVDVSSMPREVYGPLLVEACRDSAGMVSEIVFAYVPGEHRGSISGHQQLDGLRAIAGLEGSSRHDGDPALVLGLGYDGVLADTVVDLFQLEHVSCMYADPGATLTAARRCKEENALLIARAELVETAPVQDLTSWMCSMERLAGWYESNRDVMLLSIGPKPQVIASMLFALRYPSVAFRCLRTSWTRPIDVGVPTGAEPLWMVVTFAAQFPGQLALE